LRPNFGIQANAHVAKGQSGLIATTGNGQSFNAKIEYIDASLDIALIKVEGTNFPNLSIADVSAIRQGSTVVAIGNPIQGFQNTLTKGVVSAIGPMPNEPGIWIQTDASLNPVHPSIQATVAARCLIHWARSWASLRKRRFSLAMAVLCRVLGLR
jgi:S1-C subfamily serine protease